MVQGWRNRGPQARRFGAPSGVRRGRRDAGNRPQRRSGGSAEMLARSRVCDRQITLMPKPSIQGAFGLAYCIHTDTILLMPKSIDQLTAQRDVLLAQLKSIDRLRRGTLSRQVFTKEQDGRTVTQGPYFVLQGFQGGRKFSQRIPAPAAERVQEQVDNFKQFQALADQCISLTDQITQLAEGLPDAKKNSRSPKSRPSNSGKPKRS